MAPEILSAVISAVATSSVVGILFKLLVNRWYEEEQAHKKHVLEALDRLQAEVTKQASDVRVMQAEALATRADILERLASLRTYFQEKFAELNRHQEADHARIGKNEDELMLLRVDVERLRPRNGSI